MNTKYDRIGIDYNQTRKADKYIADRLFHHLNPVPGKQYLDLGCGTGNYTIELFNRGLQITGIDPSERMISYAMSKDNRINWITGTAERTGSNDGFFDGIICCLTIHHWSDLRIAFRESHRIMKKNGRYVIFTSTPEQMEGYWLNYYFPTMLNASERQMPAFDRIRKELEVSGFENIKTEKYFVSDNLQDHFLYCGKYRPGLYLKPEIRKGISSFADLSNQDEVRNGLSRLKRDIDNDNIKNIISKYENEKGDYLFIICDKADN